jgi:TolA-binding protein
MSAQVERVTCARRWEASALEDGRLGTDGRVAFERHAEACADCARERAGLAQLRKLIDADERPEATPLERRRLRSEILRKANRETVAPRSRMQIQIGAALAVAAAILIYVVARHPPKSGAGQTAASTSSSAHYEVDGHKGAHWNASQSGGTTRVALADGEAAFHVEHLAKEQRFLVALPDGEVEVRGTRFVVSVDHGHTRRVEVTEGRVALRLADVRERELYAGEAWERTSDPAAPVAAAPSATMAIPPAAPVASAISSANAPAPKLTTASAQTLVAGTSMTGTASVPAPPAAPTASVNGGRFADAMAFFRAGRYADADLAFAAFESAAPSDPRAEDAAWLRAVAKSRAGDAAGASKQAQRYLDRYPQGFRRSEAEALAKGSKP